MSDLIKDEKVVEAPVEAVVSVEENKTSTTEQDDTVDEKSYKRGQQNKWTRARTGDNRDGDNKRPRKTWEREHKVQ